MIRVIYLKWNVEVVLNEGGRRNERRWNSNRMLWGCRKVGDAV